MGFNSGFKGLKINYFECVVGGVRHPQHTQSILSLISKIISPLKLFFVRKGLLGSWIGWGEGCGRPEQQSSKGGQMNILTEKFYLILSTNFQLLKKIKRDLKNCDF